MINKWGSYLHKAGFTLGGLHTQLKKCCRHIGWTIMIHYDHPIGMQHFMKLSLSAIILHSYYYYFLFNLGYFYFSTRYFNNWLFASQCFGWLKTEDGCLKTEDGWFVWEEALSRLSPHGYYQTSINPHFLQTHCLKFISKWTKKLVFKSEVKLG